MSAPNAKDLAGLREKVDATIKAQQCEQDMRKLMRTKAQEMQEKLVALCEEKDFRERMIGKYWKNLEDCERQLLQPGISAKERENCDWCIKNHPQSLEHNRQRLQAVEKQIQGFNVSEKVAEAAMAEVLDKKRQNLEEDDLEADLNFSYASYRYYSAQADEAAAGDKRQQYSEKRDLYLQQIGETEERMAKKRA